jgi:hypothetical protein
MRGAHSAGTTVPALPPLSEPTPLHPTILLNHYAQRLVGDGQRIINVTDTNALRFIDGHMASLKV